MPKFESNLTNPPGYGILVYLVRVGSLVNQGKSKGKI